MPLLLPECQNVFVCGPVASGKTHLIKRWLTADNRHGIFDGTGEFLDDQRETIWANPKQFRERLKANPYFFRLIYEPGLDRPEDFKHVVNALWWMNNPRLLVCDEVHELLPVDSMTPTGEMILRYARKVRLGFVGASQRIADVHKLFTSGCRMTILFWTQEARDLGAIEDRWRCADMVENLRPLIHNDATGETKQVPQCVVCIKGQKPFVYDFATESAATPHGEPETNEGADHEAEPTPPAAPSPSEGEDNA